MSLPTGQCEAVVRVLFGSRSAEGRANMCDAQGYVVTPGDGGLRLLLRSHVMIPN